ncbi:MAG TPA: hypothetical protein VGC09_11910 [Rhodopila sp.]
MSTFTRVTTPPFSANPLQRFVTLKQARRAAKGAGVLAIATGISAIVEGTVEVSGNLLTPAVARGVMAYSVAMALIALLFAWRMFRRPGPVKAGVFLLFAGLNMIASVLTWTRQPTAARCS